MEDDIFDLKVTVDERSAISWLVIPVRKELNHFFHTRDLSNRLVGVDIDYRSLGLF